MQIMLIESTGLQPESVESMTAVPRTSTSRLIRSYLKTILSNAESRKIFYFLMLNMAYMLVQMLYGVWTNSLGLISDGQFLLWVRWVTVLILDVQRSIWHLIAWPLV